MLNISNDDDIHIYNFTFITETFWFLLIIIISTISRTTTQTALIDWALQRTAINRRHGDCVLATGQFQSMLWGGIQLVRTRQHDVEDAFLATTAWGASIREF